MKVKTIDGREIDLKQEDLDNLKIRLSGKLLIAGDADYDESRKVWNDMFDRKPGFIVRCLGTPDVIECIKFVREHDLLVCIKGGGHNIAGLATAEGAFMLDMSLMRGVWVDPIRKIAHAQAGCLLGDVDRETQLYGLAAILGFVSTTGITGLTLGGGFGYLTRRCGWTSDNVTGMDLVTADARLARASKDENVDLFWGLRGGGGNFGVVIGIDYELYPVGPEIVGGLVAWHASEAPKVCELYRILTLQAPPELTLMLFLRPAPLAHWLPKEIHGKPIVIISACYTGIPHEDQKAISSIKAFGNPVGDILIPRPYTQMQSLLDTTQPKGRRNYWKSEFLPHIKPALCDKIIKHAARITSPHSSVILMHIGGALNNLGEEHSAAGNRDAQFIINFLGSWEKADDDRQNIEWARNAWDDIKSFSTGGNYINFQTEDEGQNRIDTALGNGLQRLTRIKSKWDPQNVFRINRNIKPF
jgi:FAD/FMN-containing dehydrogenase